MALTTTAAKAANDFKLNPSIAPLAILDTSANLAAVFDMLKPLAAAGKIVSIALTDTRPLALSYASFSTGSPLLVLLPSNNTLVLSGVPVSAVVAAQANTHVVGFTVADTAANTQAGFAVLSTAAKLSAILLTDSSPFILTFQQFSTYAVLLGKLPTNAVLTLTGATAAGAAIAQANSRVKSFTVADSAAAVAANLTTLLAASKLTRVVLTDKAPLLVSMSQYMAIAATAGKFSPDTLFAVSGATAQMPAALQAAANVVSFKVIDIAANIGAALPALIAAGKLQSVAVTDTAPIPVAYTQLAAFAVLFSRLPTNYALSVSGVTVAGAAAVIANTHIKSFTIADSAANISAALDLLNIGARLISIVPTDSGIIVLNPGQYNNVFGVLNKIAGSWLADAPGLTVSTAALAQASSHIRRFSVADTAAAVAANLDALNADTKLTAIQLTSGTTLAVTARQVTADAGALGKIAQPYQLAVSGATVASLAALHANTHVVSIQVADSAANIANGLAVLAGDTLVTSIALTGGTILTVDEARYFAFGDVFGKLIAADGIAIAGVTAANAQAAQAGARVVSFGVVDTAANIQANLNALSAAGKLTTLTISGPSNLTLTYGQFGAGTALWGKIAGAYTFSISAVPAAAAAALSANAHVANLSVNDTLANIGASLNALEVLAKAGKLTSIQVSDSGGHLTLTPAQYTALADAIALMRGGFTIDTTAPAPASGAKINLIWDAQALAAPTAFRSAVSYAAQYIQSLILNPIQINIAVGYGEVAGSTLGNGVLGAAGPTLGVGRSYAQFKNDLTTHAASPVMQGIVANLPSVDPSQGGSIYVASAEEKALGLMNANATGIDGTMGFAADPNLTLYAYDPASRAIAGKYDLIGIVEHEITHALGRIAIGGTYGNWISALDVFRFSAPGVHSPNAGGSAYFSIDNGVTNLDPFSTSSDLADWSSAAGNDANNAFSRSGVVNGFSQADILQLAALGFATSGTPVAGGVLLSPGSAAGGLNAPALSFAGAPMLAILDEEAPIFHASLSPAGGIEQISGFEYGIFELRIDLMGANPSAFGAFDTTVDGRHAIALANTNDLTHGLVLTGLPAEDTAADLMAHHLRFTGGEAIVA